MTLLLVVLFIFIVNIPFGYWRSNVKKFALQWFLSIHIPVPLIVILRLTTDIGFAWTSYLFTITAFFLGQLAGKWIYKFLREHKSFVVSSCLVMDIFNQNGLERSK